MSIIVKIDLKTPLSELLVCVTSGPWFPNLSKPKLWTTDETMELDGDGTHQLVRLVQAITEGTEIHARLAASPVTLLEPCMGFQGEKQKALRIMATLKYTERGHFWRTGVIVDALKPNSESILHRGENDTIKTVAIDCLAVMTTHCPDMQATVKDAVGYEANEQFFCVYLVTILTSFFLCVLCRLTLLLPNDDTLMKTLALRMGTMFCGLSRDGQHLGPQSIFDVQKQRLVPRRKCKLCSGLEEGDQVERMDHDQSPDASFLNLFNRLIPISVTPQARIALLNGLSRVFCHLSLDTVDLSTLEFGKFVLGQLTDKSEDARNTAG